MACSNGIWELISVLSRKACGWTAAEVIVQSPIGPESVRMQAIPGDHRN